MSDYGSVVVNGIELRKKNRRKARNEIIVYEDHAEIILYDINKVEKARAKISLDKVDEASRYSWYPQLRDRSSYVMTKIDGKTLKLHNILFNPPEGLICDHINRDGLDNTNENIRFCTAQQNLFNVGPKKNNKAGYPGIYWNPANKKWRARIKVNRVPIEIGSFINLDDAIKARKEAEQFYYGEFAPQGITE